MYQAVQGDVGKGILEIPPATVIITVNSTWSAALISRNSALWVSAKSWHLPCQASLFSRVPCCALFVLLRILLLKCLSLPLHKCRSVLDLRMVSKLVTTGGV